MIVEYLGIVIEDSESLVRSQQQLSILGFDDGIDAIAAELVVPCIEVFKFPCFPVEDVDTGTACGEPHIMMPVLNDSVHPAVTYRVFRFGRITVIYQLFGVKMIGIYATAFYRNPKNPLRIKIQAVTEQFE